MNIFVNFVIALWMGLVLVFTSSNQASVADNDSSAENMSYYSQSETNNPYETIDYLLTHQISAMQSGMVNPTTIGFSKVKVKSPFHFKYKNVRTIYSNQLTNCKYYQAEEHSFLYAYAIDYFIYALERIII